MVTLAPEVESSSGVVAAWPPEASEIGAEVIAAGGNAMDAAAAAALGCCMARPEMTGIGGYVLSAVVLDARTDTVLALDSSSTAPQAAHAEMFDVNDPEPGRAGINEDEYLCTVEGDANLFGGRSIGTPGVIGGIGALWEQWGSVPWSAIVQPSIDLVERGVTYSEFTANCLREMQPVLAGYPDTAAVLMPDGRLPAPGDVWHRPGMSTTLMRISENGWREAYTGELGQRIVDAVQADGGLLTMTDMELFEPTISQPYTTTFRDATISGPPLPNGCITSLQILNLLDTIEVMDDDSIEYWHVMAEVLKIAWRDRLTTLADPEFFDVDIERILSRSDARARTSQLRDHRLGNDSAPLEPTASNHGTLHLSTADAVGNVVALTLTHGAAFGSCLSVPGTGMILGHGMSRLDPRSGRPNSIAGGKRPLNNVAPMITRLPGRDVASGLPGGRRIVSVGAQIAQRLVDFDASASEAVLAPRMHVTHSRVEVSDTLDPGLIAELEALGHVVDAVADVGGSAHIAEFDKRGATVRGAGSKGLAAGV